MAAVSHATYLGFLNVHLQVKSIVLIVMLITELAEGLGAGLSIEVDNCDCLHNFGLAECPTLDLVLLKEFLCTFLDRFLGRAVNDFALG